MCVRPTRETEEALGWRERLKVAGCQDGQQAGALCRVNRAQPNNRASGVSCTAWLGHFLGTCLQ